MEGRAAFRAVGSMSQAGEPPASSSRVRVGVSQELGEGQVPRMRTARRWGWGGEPERGRERFPRMV